MDTKPRLTKQGITDLNHYGPKPSRPVAEVAGPVGDEGVTEAAKNTSPPVGEKKPDETVSAGA
jgi:hypothetical protein